MDNTQLVHGAAWYIVFLFSTTAHEASHALAALKLGDDTAHRGGQVSLDPMPHIRREPFGMVVIPVLSFIMAQGGWMIGWASAPYNPIWARQYPKRAALMSAAGPAANLLLLLLAALLLHVGLKTGYFTLAEEIRTTHLVNGGSGPLAEAAVILTSVLFSLNLLLVTFNLLPVPPLDGSGVLSLFLPDSVAEKFQAAMRSPAFTLVGFFIAWYVFKAIYPAIQSIAISLLFPGAYQ